MRFLADESCDFAVVRALRTDGHHVLAVAATHQGADDSTVIGLAVNEQRILLTEDKDFGQLVYANLLPSAGVILLRFPASARARLAQAVVEFVRLNRTRLAGAFVVLQPGRSRVSRAPES